MHRRTGRRVLTMETQPPVLGDRYRYPNQISSNTIQQTILMPSSDIFFKLTGPSSEFANQVLTDVDGALKGLSRIDFVDLDYAQEFGSFAEWEEAGDPGIGYTQSIEKRPWVQFLPELTAQLVGKGRPSYLDAQPELADDPYTMLYALDDAIENSVMRGPMKSCCLESWIPNVKEMLISCWISTMHSRVIHNGERTELDMLFDITLTGRLAVSMVEDPSDPRRYVCAKLW